MLDFIKIIETQSKKTTVIHPIFLVTRSKDLMIRGKSFYAVWDEKNNLWRQDEHYIQELVDEATYDYAKQRGYLQNEYYTCKWMKDFSSGLWKEWILYAKNLPDNYVNLDEHIVFANQEVKKTDYVTKILSYPIQELDTPAYDEMMSVLYEPEERRKLEWAIGSIICGDSRFIQKFFVLYGGPGTGKSTVLNMIQGMFPGYWGLFRSSELGSNVAFALESMKDNPLIAIEHDGDLSRLEANENINSIVSHETMSVNEKFKSKYNMRFRSMLFMGTNKPVRISDSKSGLLRRLIDVIPTGNRIPVEHYNQIVSQLSFEYPGIAYRCLRVYESMGANYYNEYVAESMILKTNDFYNFVEDNLDMFLSQDCKQEGLPLSVAWRRYKEYCEDAAIKYPMSRRVFRDELGNYFEEFKDRYEGKYSVYLGFREYKFKHYSSTQDDEEPQERWLKFDQEVSLFDEEFADCPAQYAKTADETPLHAWNNVTTTLKDVDTRKTHYMIPPMQLIVIDFDLKENGEKCFEKNLLEASKWPVTYAELSKSGQGIHLHYWYEGDVNELSNLYDKDVEIKVFTGKSSLRRRLTKCNHCKITKLASGLPLKERRKSSMIDEKVLRSERSLRDLLLRNLRKEIHPSTKSSIDFIYKILEDAYKEGFPYDVRDLRPSVQAFAMSSTHQADYCIKMVSKMHFQSEEARENETDGKEDIPMVFYDVEVFPNLFVIVWKKAGKGNQNVRMINPKPKEVEELTKFRLVGFNNRKYDNHILYARMMGYNEKQLYNLSQRIIAGDKDAFFGEAYNLSYTDVWDFLSPTNKMGLKKWEIKLGIHHLELGLPWDQPVPEELWTKVADYCCNDVEATEAVFDANQEDWIARQILAEWADMTVNDTTNSLTTRIIVGKDPHPQSKFIYTDLSTIFPGYRFDPYGIPKEEYKEGAKIVSGKSIYRGEDPGEGGKVSAFPGIWYNVAVLDVGSMHPHSMIRLKVFGEEYTLNFEHIVDARMYIKHKQYDKAKEVLPQKLWKYLDDPSKAKGLASALKGAVNPVYGLTSAKFENKLRDPRNKDNIVAKYGALFMINLNHEIEEHGWKCCHIKTDSVKIPNATPEIIQFVKDYGKQYGFEFEHEATYERMCLVNESTYIAFVKEEDGELLDKPYWTATGTQFQVPYVFKTLFSHEELEFADFCETKSVSTALYLDFNEGFDDPSQHDYRFVGRVGQFCPIKPGCGGGALLRQEEGGEFSAVTGTKISGTKDEVYRWMESEMVRQMSKQDDIDMRYYDDLMEKAIDKISEFGDFQKFVSLENMDMSWMNVPDGDEEEIPFDEVKPFPMNPPVQ